MMTKITHQTIYDEIKEKLEKLSKLKIIDVLYTTDSYGIDYFEVTGNKETLMFLEEKIIEKYHSRCQTEFLKFCDNYDECEKWNGSKWDSESIWCCNETPECYNILQIKAIMKIDENEVVEKIFENKSIWHWI